MRAYIRAHSNRSYQVTSHHLLYIWMPKHAIVDDRVHTLWLQVLVFHMLLCYKGMKVSVFHPKSSIADLYLPVCLFLLSRGRKARYKRPNYSLELPMFLIICHNSQCLFFCFVFYWVVSKRKLVCNVSELLSPSASLCGTWVLIMVIPVYFWAPVVDLVNSDLKWVIPFTQRDTIKMPSSMCCSYVVIVYYRINSKTWSSSGEIPATLDSVDEVNKILVFSFFSCCDL